MLGVRCLDWLRDRRELPRPRVECRPSAVPCSLGERIVGDTQKKARHKRWAGCDIWIRREAAIFGCSRCLFQLPRWLPATDPSASQVRARRDGAAREGAACSRQRCRGQVGALADANTAVVLASFLASRSTQHPRSWRPQPLARALDGASAFPDTFPSTLRPGNRRRGRRRRKTHETLEYDLHCRRLPLLAAARAASARWRWAGERGRTRARLVPR